MTKSQKEIILTMRHALCSYTQIAEKTGLSVGAIKSYCYRNGLNTESLKSSSVYAKTAESLYLLRLKLAPDDSALTPVKQRGGIFIVMTTRTTH